MNATDLTPDGRRRRLTLECIGDVAILSERLGRLRANLEELSDLLPDRSDAAVSIVHALIDADEATDCALDVARHVREASGGAAI